MKSFPALYLLAILLLLALQLVLGADLILTSILTLIAASAMWPFSKPALTVSGLLYSSTCLYSGTFALLMKTLLIQPVQQNLIAPQFSAGILLAGHVAVSTAYGLATAIPARGEFCSRLKADFDSVRILRLFAPWGFVLGYATQVLHVIFRPHFINGSNMTTNGFGGFGSFYFLINLAFAAQVGLIYLGRWKNEATVRASIMFVLILGLSLVENVKKDVLDAVLILVMSMFAFRAAPKPGPTLIACVFVVFFMFILSPLIHITRANSTVGSLDERIGITEKILLQNNFDIGKINALNDTVFRSYSDNYRSSGSYVYPYTINIDRFALVLPADQVAREKSSSRVSLLEVGHLIAQQALPSILIKKSPGVLADLVSWRYGFRPYLTVGRPVVGLAASTYAIGGFLGIFAIGIPVMLAFFWATSALAGDLTASPWAVGIAVFLSVLAEKEVDAIVVLVVRDIPILLVTLGIMVASVRYLTARSGMRLGPGGVVPPREPDVQAV